jgi:hypothetical protein
MAKQFTVRLKNEPGALARLTGRLGEHGIDIRDISAGAVGSYGCAVLSTNNDRSAADVLRKARYKFVEGDVIHVAVEDRPGTFAQMTNRLAEAGINVIGVITLRRHQGKTELAITVDDVARARRVIATAMK